MSRSGYLSKRVLEVAKRRCIFLHPSPVFLNRSQQVSPMFTNVRMEIEHLSLEKVDEYRKEILSKLHQTLIINIKIEAQNRKCPPEFERFHAVGSDDRLAIGGQCHVQNTTRLRLCS